MWILNEVYELNLSYFMSVLTLSYVEGRKNIQDCEAMILSSIPNRLFFFFVFKTKRGVEFLQSLRKMSKIEWTQVITGWGTDWKQLIFIIYRTFRKLDHSRAY